MLPFFMGLSTLKFIPLIIITLRYDLLFFIAKKVGKKASSLQDSLLIFNLLFMYDQELKQFVKNQIIDCFCCKVKFLQYESF